VEPLLFVFPNRGALHGKSKPIMQIAGTTYTTPSDYVSILCSGYYTPLFYNDSQQEKNIYAHSRPQILILTVVPSGCKTRSRVCFFVRDGLLCCLAKMIMIILYPTKCHCSSGRDKMSGANLFVVESRCRFQKFNDCKF